MLLKQGRFLTKEKEEFVKQVEEEYNLLKSLPKERAKEEFNQIISDNPDLAKEINKLIGKEKLGYEGEFIKSLGVENGQRVKYIFEKINKLKTKEEKKIYYQELIDKGVVSKKPMSKFYNFLMENKSYLYGCLWTIFIWALIFWILSVPSQTFPSGDFYDGF